MPTFIFSTQNTITMKKIILSSFLLLNFLVVTSSLLAQNRHHYYGTDAARFYKGASQVFVNDKLNTVSFVRLNTTENITEQNAPQWLRNDVLKLNNDFGMKQYMQEKDYKGFTH